jgi:hypothetical protein
MNMRNMISTVENGCIAIIEGADDVNIYSTAKLRSQENKCETVQKVATHKATFQPTKLVFNPQNPNYLAVVGIRNVQICVLNKSFQVVSTLMVDLMLEAFGSDLTLVNVMWVPGF